MEAPHQGDGAYLDEVWSSPRRLVCISRYLTVSLLVLSNSMELDAMVQTWPRLRLYAFPPDCSTSGSSGVRLCMGDSHPVGSLSL